MTNACVADYREDARRRLPRFVFDYLDRGAEDGDSLDRNVQAFKRLLLKPRIMRDVWEAQPQVTLFGHRYSAPMVVGPTGLNGLFWPKADIILAQAAAQLGLPFVMATASTSLLEDVRRAVPDQPLWFQLYVQEDHSIAKHLMGRAWAAGYSVLFLTVDTPVHGKRDHDMHNGFRLPLRITPKMLLDVLTHPRWAMHLLLHGGPQLVNIARSLDERPDLTKQAASLSRAMDKRLAWNDLKWLRDSWPGPIVLKGVQSEEDVKLAHQHGFDGVVLSNHGGRQLAGAPAPINLVPRAVQAVPQDMMVFVDGGVRRGADVAKAKALGADAVLLGRAPLFGLAASGETGARDVLQLLLEELHIALQLVGCCDINTLTHQYLDYDGSLPLALQSYFNPAS